MTYPSMYVKPTQNTLNQGDIFSRFATKLLPSVNPEEVGFMVLTYTCDLVNTDDLSFIHICPVFSINVFISSFLDLNKDKSAENLKKGLKNKVYNLSQYIPKNYFFLAPNSVFANQPAYADIEQIWNLPVEYYGEIKENRKVSLNPPWREKLGWKLGYLFNRIALDDVRKEPIEEFIDNNEILFEWIKTN